MQNHSSKHNKTSILQMYQALDDRITSYNMTRRTYNLSIWFVLHDFLHWVIYRIAIWRPDDTIQNDGTDAAYSKTWIHSWWAVVFGWSWNPSWNMRASQWYQIPWRDIWLGIHISEWQDIDMWRPQWKYLYGGMTKYWRLVNSYWIVGVMGRFHLI